jgi:hypothetical protein
MIYWPSAAEALVRVAVDHSSAASQFWNMSTKRGMPYEMSGGPSDYGSGYLFESQKGISDRRAALGLGQGPSTFASNDGGSSASGSAGRGVVGFLLLTMFWFFVRAGWLSWQVIKIAFTAIFSCRR